MIRKKYIKGVADLLPYSRDRDWMGDVINDVSNAIAKLLKRWQLGHEYFSLLMPLLINDEKHLRSAVVEAMLFLGNKLTFKQVSLFMSQQNFWRNKPAQANSQQ